MVFKIQKKKRILLIKMTLKIVVSGSILFLALFVQALAVPRPLRDEQRGPRFDSNKLLHIPYNVEAGTDRFHQSL